MRHGRALDVPARPPAPPRAVPAGLLRARGLPEHEIHRIALVGGHLDAGARDHVVHVPVRQAPVFLVGGHREQHVALRRVGVALRDERLDHGDHLPDPFGRPRLVVRGQAAQRRHVLVVPAQRLVGDLADRPPGLGGARVDLVVHVGDVAHVGHAGPVVPQQPRQHVEHDHVARVAQMRPVVDRRPAEVEADVPGIERAERLHPSARRVAQAQPLAGRGRVGHGGLHRFRGGGPRRLPERVAGALGPPTSCQRACGMQMIAAVPMRGRLPCAAVPAKPLALPPPVPPAASPAPARASSPPPPGR